MPGLKQAGKTANYRLKKILKKFGYEPLRHTPAMWKHTSHDMDDLGAKYTKRQDDNHLRNVLYILNPPVTPD